MVKRHNIHLLAFSFAILMVLLRPYAAYRITSQAGFIKDPVKINNMLQRLVKKKDEHHAAVNDDMIIVQNQRTGRMLPFILLLFSPSLLSFIAAGIKCFRAAFSAIFIHSYNKQYLLLARLRI